MPKPSKLQAAGGVNKLSPEMLAWLNTIPGDAPGSADDYQALEADKAQPSRWIPTSMFPQNNQIQKMVARMNSSNPEQYYGQMPKVVGIYGGEYAPSIMGTTNSKTGEINLSADIVRKLLRRDLTSNYGSKASEYTRANIAQGLYGHELTHWINNQQMLGETSRELPMNISSHVMNFLQKRRQFPEPYGVTDYFTDSMFDVKNRVHHGEIPLKGFAGIDAFQPGGFKDIFKHVPPFLDSHNKRRGAFMPELTSFTLGNMFLQRPYSTP